jgi:oligopeptide/dipeptide ABC transporter ATP-binding protein
MASSAPILEVRDLRVQCETAAGQVLAVAGSSLSIRPGERVALIGESGSGKSTFVRSLVGLLHRNCRVVEGSIRFGGKDIFGEGTDDRVSVRGRRIGMVFQNAAASLNPVLKVSTQMREVLQQHLSLGHAEMDARIDSALRAMGFQDTKRVLKAYPHQLSGGMCQRVSIAIAVLAEPDLIVTDECTSALDASTQAEVVTLLRELTVRQRKALLFLTHNILLAAELCDRIVVIYGGQIVEDGSVSAILKTPRHPYTAALLEAVPSWKGRAPLVPIKGSPPTISPGTRGCRFEPRCAVALPECKDDDIGWRIADGCHGYRCVLPEDASRTAKTGG